MLKSQIVRNAIPVLACIGMMIPSSALQAGGPAAPAKAKVQVTDAKLTAGGVVSGQIVDAQGNGIKDAPVSVRHGSTEVVRTSTDANGKFAVRNLRTGIHTVAVGNQGHVYRLWNAQTAPPAAKDAIVMVADPTVVRGQNCTTEGCNSGGMMGGGNGALIGGSVLAAGIIGGVIGYSVKDDDNRFRSP